MQVAFNGSPEQLRAAIEARGMAVSGSGTSLRVSRRPAGGNGGNGGHEGGTGGNGDPHEDIPPPESPPPTVH